MTHATVHDCIGHQLAQRDDDLTRRLLANLDNLEWQVNVSAAGGELVEEDGHKFYSDGCNKWWNIRVPRGADTDEPSWKPYPITGHHLDCFALIGSTGWDWRSKRSLWLGYDFDTITGHAKGVGVSDNTLDAVLEVAKRLPWIESRRSKGGSGVHLYAHCLIEGIENHTVHAALGRAILGMMAYEAGFDFKAAVDVPGGNMWVWANTTTAPNAFALLNPATATLSEADLPLNWRDQIAVVTRKRTRVQLRGVDTDADTFQAALDSRPLVTLSTRHRATIEALKEHGPVIYVADYGLIQTHTAALAKIKRRGPFSTRSDGIGDGQPNCFMFPEEDGAWKVCKFGLGSPETETWETSEAGWTWCYYDRLPDLATACRIAGCILVGQKYTFRAADQLAKVIDLLGGALTIPHGYGKQSGRFALTPHGLAIEISRKVVDGRLPVPEEGWGEGVKDHIGCTLDLRPKAKYREVPRMELVRAVRAPNGEDQGLWMQAMVDGEALWVVMSTDRAKTVVRDEVGGGAAVDAILAAADRNAWKLVNLPFQPEYPGGRQWNRGAAQLKYAPVPGPHPYWDRVLANGGRSLTAALTDPNHPYYDWARDANILTGGDYLLNWLRCLVREPMSHLPGLFFFGEQRSGKSTIYEGSCLLLTGGHGYIHNCLTGDQFNSEIENRVLCGCEEVDLSNSDKAADNIRAWLTGPTVTIRAHYRGAYDGANTFHFMHMSEHLGRCYSQPGDTRMTVFHITKPEDYIPNKGWLFDRLREEGPAITHTLLSGELPPRVDRLRLPAIDTADKIRAGIAADPVRAFYLARCLVEPGAATLKEDMRKAFADFAGEAADASIFGKRFQVVSNGQCPAGKNSDDKHVYKNVVLI